MKQPPLSWPLSRITRLFIALLRVRFTNVTSVTLAILLPLFSQIGQGAPSDAWHWMPPLVSPTQDNLLGIAYGNGRFVAVGNQGSIVSSDDGTKWVQHKSRETLNFVVYGHGQFVACNNRTVVTSPDGVNWTLHECCGGALGYGNGLFVVSNEDFTYVSDNPTDGRLRAHTPKTATRDWLIDGRESVTFRLWNMKIGVDHG